LLIQNRVETYMRPRTTHVILTMNSILLGLSLAATISATSPTADEDELLRNATLVFEHAVETPAAAIPAPVLMRATAIAVVPAAVRDGTRFYGNGVVSARGARADYWTPPAVFAFEGAIPLDLGTGAADFILVAQTQRGLDYFLQGRVRNTATHSIVAGPLGHGTPIGIGDLLAYVKFANDLAGVTIAGWVLQDMRESNAVLYGRPYSTDDIVRGAGFFYVKGPARMWRNALAAYFREMS
jgi:lipid-binding SYLF domain-containing protein